MAQTVYSLRIFGSAGLAPGAGVVGPVVPTGFVYIVRDVDVFEMQSLASQIITFRNQLGGVIWQFESGSTIASRVGQWRGRQVFNEGEQVGFVSAVGLWSVAASGYQLTLP